MGLDSLHCCHVGCPEDADFEIFTVRRDGGIAGPDIYSDDTHACEAHVGDLLGYQPDARDPEEIMWHVRPIAQRLTAS